MTKVMYDMLHVTFSPDGKKLAILEGEGGKGYIGFWDLQGNQLAFWKADNNQPPVNFVKSLDFHPDNNQDILVTLGIDQEIKIWDTKKVNLSRQPRL